MRFYHPREITQYFIVTLSPQVVYKLHKAACGYKEWKQNHRPEYKPWLYPEQNKLPLINKDDLESNNYVENQCDEVQQETEVIGEDPGTYSSEDNLEDYL